GVIREPPRASKVPPRLTRVIARGLALRPEDRPQAMDVLLAAIEAAIRPRRRWLVLEAAAADALALAGSWALSDRTDETPAIDPAARCSAAGRSIAATWGEAREAELRRASAGSGLVYADDLADRVVARLGDYSGRWAWARRDACLAHHVGGELSARQL